MKLLQKNKFRDLVSLSRVLTDYDKKRLSLITLIQIFLSILDLVGVTLIGVIGALTISGVRSQTPQGKVSQVLSSLGLSHFSFQSQTVILALIALTLLVIRTLLSVIITRRTLFFLSRRSAEISSTLISRVMAQPLSTLNRFNSQYIHYTLTTGTTSLTLGVFGNIVAVSSDLALLLVLAVGISIIDPLTAFATIFIFGSIMVYIYFQTNSKTQKIAKRYSDVTIQDSEALLELVSGYREAFIRNRRGFFADKAIKIKWEIADYSAELAWLPNVSKYVVEIAFTVGTVCVAGLQFLANDSVHAIGSLTLFLAAGTRITPALLRVQQNLVMINGSLVRAKPTIDLFDQTDPKYTLPKYDSRIDIIHEGFTPSITIKDLSFKYPGSDRNTLSAVNLEVWPGETVAIVGPSGAGKSTLIDLLLGIYIPSQGTIALSGCAPAESIFRWPGAIGYVPQEVILRSGSIASNIGSGFDLSGISEELIGDAVAIAQLDQFIGLLPQGVDTEVGERGNQLSGGQRQRVGIARAMFTKPKLLVLDEATSSLDAQTEADISAAIQDLKGKVTLILIAHRLSTVLKADRIIYLESGKVLANGSFIEVREAVPDFDRQAQLMGL